MNLLLFFYYFYSIILALTCLLHMLAAFIVFIHIYIEWVEMTVNLLGDFEIWINLIALPHKSLPLRYFSKSSDSCWILLPVYGFHSSQSITDCFGQWMHRCYNWHTKFGTQNLYTMRIMLAMNLRCIASCCSGIPAQ